VSEVRHLVVPYVDTCTEKQIVSDTSQKLRNRMPERQKPSVVEPGRTCQQPSKRLWPAVTPSA